MPRLFAARCLALLIALATWLPAQSWAISNPATSPGARSDAGLAHDLGRWATVLFGGRNGTTVLNDTWEWNSGTWTPRLTIQRPPARWGHAMAFDARRGRVVVFGGFDQNGSALADTWEWDGNWYPRSTATAPSPRGGVRMTFDGARGVMVLFGGETAASGGTALADLWEWDGVNWAQRTTTNTPPARAHAAQVWDLRLHKTLVYGGRDGSNVLADTWLFDGADWSQVTNIIQPPARFAAGIGFDSPCGRAVMFGGTDGAGQRRGDCWHWDGATWAQYTNPLMPSARTGPAMVYEEQYRVMRMFGGNDASGQRADTWQYGNPCSRWMTVSGTVGIGQTPHFRYLYPPAAANHFCWTLFTSHMTGAVSLPVPGFPTIGLDRVDVFNVFAYAGALLSPSQVFDTPVAIPNVAALAGMQFDVQSVDIDLDTYYVWFADNDIEATIAYPQPGANFTLTPNTGNAPLTVSFTNNSTFATTWFWAFGDGTFSNLQNPPPRTYVAGTYTVTLQVTGPGGVNQSSQQLVVTGGPVASFTATPQSGLAPLTVTFTNTSTNATTYNWSFGDSTTSTLQNPPPKTYTSAGSFTVTLTASGPAGTNSTSLVISVGVGPVANFAVQPATGTAPLTVSFFNLSTNATSFLWDFGDGTQTNTQVPAAKIYTNPGIYTVTLTASSALGSNSTTRIVTVTGALPAPSFTATPTAGALPLAVQFTDTSTLSPIAWSWDFDNNGTVDSNLQNPQFTYTTAGVYSVRLDVTNANGTATLTRVGLIAAGVVPTNLPTMVPIPAGSFTMGGAFGGNASLPAHTVTISTPFWMSAHEITQGQFLSLMGTNPSYFQGSQWPNEALRPVERSTWVQATAYCAALTAVEQLAGHVPPGFEYRLPTEAEWEYCCRAGTTTDWYTGNALVCSDANFNPGPPCTPSGVIIPSGQSTVVGTRAPNAFGLYDMHGNVQEWCRDSWNFQSNYPSGPVTDPFVGTGPYRILRGGSWNTSAANCASPTRFAYPPDAALFATSEQGFRVVLAPILP